MQVWKPPPKQTLSEWSDTYRKLSSEASAEPGQWRTDRAPYLKGIMDAISDPEIERIVWMKAAQVGYTEVLLNTLGYFVHYQPSPIMLMQPTQEMGEAFSKDRLAPMIRDTPVLTDRIVEAKSRDSGNTILHKKFVGGHITITGANSAASLAMRPIRALLCDEVDRYPASAGTEGDPINLGIKRTKNFGNRKIILGGTPTIKGASRIEMGFEESDKRYYFVPCPHCKEMQRLEWQYVKFNEEGSNRERADSAYYACRYCGAVIMNEEKYEMLSKGEWRATAPWSGIAGFHISALYSPWVPWSEIVYSFLVDRHKPDTFKTWVNTELGETYEDASISIDPDSLLNRRGTHTEDSLPEETLLLTMGIDTQPDRVECQLLAWGREEENWIVNQHVIRGDPGSQKWWDEEVDEYIKRPRYTMDGRRLLVECVCVDSGGSNTQDVYNFTVKRKTRRVFAIKGKAGQGVLAWPKKASKTPKSRAGVWILGVDTIKSTLYTRLARKVVPGPAYIHLHPEADADFCKQLTSEKTTVEFQKGRPVQIWSPKVEGDAQEAQDCWVYGYAAMLARGGPKLLERLAQRRGPAKEGAEVDSSQELPKPREPEKPRQPEQPRPSSKPFKRKSNPFLKGRSW